MPTEILEKPGKKVVLLGNEAIARGAVEAGVGLVASYPGTPSSEVPITLSIVAEKTGFYFEYSSNEKVAFETAAGAAWAGVRSLTAMKHYGLNVASDSVMPVVYTGVKGGLVIMVADDPEGWSSAQSEQDTRYFARMAKMPMIEPSSPQECLDFTKLAFDISEKFEIPVLLRTTTKVSHSVGTVKLGEMRKPASKGKFEKDPARYNNIRPQLQVNHRKVAEKIEKIRKHYHRKLNKVLKGEGDIGIITLGVGFEYIRELLQDLNLNPPIAKIGLSHPLSEDFIRDFIKDKKTVLVVEELEPIIENFVEMVAKDVNPGLIIHGKDLLPQVGEYNLERLMPAFEKVFSRKSGVDLDKHRKMVEKALKGLPPRKPVFCPGCPHRSTFYAVKKVFGDDAIYAGDIGCYVLGVFEPYKMQDFFISMGASLGLAHGISKVSDQDIVVFVGDSTFFHASMPGLANYKFNDGKAPLVVVMDNHITAMTGHQPHPGSGFTGMGEQVNPIKIEEVAIGLGAEVRVANAFSQDKLMQALNELKKLKGPRVLVSRGECRLLMRRRMRRKGAVMPKFEIARQDLESMEELTEKFACPGIIEMEIDGELIYQIDPDMCWGCSVCMQIASKGVIKPSKRGKE